MHDWKDGQVSQAPSKAERRSTARTSAGIKFVIARTQSVRAGLAHPGCLLLLVAEKTAAADDLGNLRRNHLFPGFVTAADSLEHIARKDLQIFGIIVIELHETAATTKIIVE